MKHPKTLFVTTIVLGLFSFVVLVFERLALADIMQGREPDLRLEWAVVHAAFLPVLLFHILGLASAIMAVRLLRRQRP